MFDLLRSHFVGMHEARKNLTRLLDELSAEGEDVVITRQGKPRAVIVDIEKYLEVQQALKEFADPRYLSELLQAREEIQAGDGISAEEVFRQKGL